MTLCDTGIIVAAINLSDRHHTQAITLLANVRSPFVTTWACMTEAMHLVGAAGQEKLRRLIENEVFRFYVATQADALRACQLMRLYADAPMDFADASLVIAAENMNITRILTLDRHFYAYLINGKTPFEVLP
ncbi:MAG: PIN domain-containing protein [Armatimonadetes bacterium]|nr:PIN domain-containing protein [Armatimonadota bacterium]